MRNLRWTLTLAGVLLLLGIGLTLRVAYCDVAEVDGRVTTWSCR